MNDVKIRSKLEMKSVLLFHCIFGQPRFRSSISIEAASRLSWTLILITFFFNQVILFSQALSIVLKQEWARVSIFLANDFGWPVRSKKHLYKLPSLNSNDFRRRYKTSELDNPGTDGGQFNLKDQESAPLDLLQVVLAPPV